MFAMGYGPNNQFSTAHACKLCLILCLHQQRATLHPVDCYLFFDDCNIRISFIFGPSDVWEKHLRISLLHQSCLNLTFHGKCNPRLLCPRYADDGVCPSVRTSVTAMIIVGAKRLNVTDWQAITRKFVSPTASKSVQPYCTRDHSEEDHPVCALVGLHLICIEIAAYDVTFNIAAALIENSTDLSVCSATVRGLSVYRSYLTDGPRIAKISMSRTVWNCQSESETTIRFSVCWQTSW
jgi:hypothetical protein